MAATALKYAPQRQHDRTDCRAPAVVSCGGGVHTGVCENVSPGGAYFRGASAAVGGEVQLVLCLPSLGPIHLAGQVCHADPDGFGLRFTWVPTSSAIALRVFLHAWR